MTQSPAVALVDPRLNSLCYLFIIRKLNTNNLNNLNLEVHSKYTLHLLCKKRAESLLRQPRCAGLGGGRRRSVLRGRGGGNGREAESRIGQGGQERGGARSLQIAVDSPGGCQAPHPGHRRVPIERATWLEQRRRQQRQPRLQAAETVQRAVRSESARWSPSSDSVKEAGAWP